MDKYKVIEMTRKGGKVTANEISKPSSYAIARKLVEGLQVSNMKDKCHVCGCKNNNFNYVSYFTDKTVFYQIKKVEN